MAIDSATEQLFAITICARRKPGMSEDDYHHYISKVHAGHLKQLLVDKKIVDYTMVSIKLGCVFCSTNKM
jgi:hypothetical protein